MFRTLREARSYYENKIKELRSTSYDVGIPECDSLISSMQNFRIKRTVQADSDDYEAEDWGREIGSTYTIASSKDIKDLIDEVWEIRNWMSEKSGVQVLSDISIADKLGEDNYKPSEDNNEIKFAESIFDNKDEDPFGGLGQDVGITDDVEQTESKIELLEEPPLTLDGEQAPITVSPQEPVNFSNITLSKAEKLLKAQEDLNYCIVCTDSIIRNIVTLDGPVNISVNDSMRERLNKSAMYTGISVLGRFKCDNLIQFRTDENGNIERFETHDELLGMYWDMAMSKDSVDEFDNYIDCLEKDRVKIVSSTSKDSVSYGKVYTYFIEDVKKTRARALEQINLKSQPIEEPVQEVIEPVHQLSSVVCLTKSWYDGTADFYFFLRYFTFESKSIIGPNNVRYTLMSDMLVEDEHMDTDRLYDGCVTKGTMIMPDGTMICRKPDNTLYYRTQSDWIPEFVGEGFNSPFNSNVETPLARMLIDNTKQNYITWRSAAMPANLAWEEKVSMFARCYLDANNGRPFFYFDFELVADDGERDLRDTSYYLSPASSNTPYEFLYKDRILLGGKSRAVMEQDKKLEHSDSIQAGKDAAMATVGNAFNGIKKFASGVKGKKSGFANAMGRFIYRNDNSEE